LSSSLYISREKASHPCSAALVEYCAAMRLARIEWSNYRRIPDGSITIRQHLVLVGPNDAGKSSLLRALHLCLGSQSGQLSSALRERDFTDPGEPLKLSVTLKDLELHERVAFPDEIDLGPPESLRIQVEATITPGDPDSLAVSRTLPGAGRPKGLSRLQLQTIHWAFVSATRSLIRELGPGGGSALQTLLAEIDIGEDRTTIADALSSLQTTLDASGSLRSLRVSLADALTATLPRDVDADDLHFKSENDLDGTLLRGITITMAEGSEEAPLSDQSDGVRSLALLAVLGASQQAVSILGIDEPEIHLHAHAQRSLGRALLEGSAQLCIATHSSSLVGVCDPLDIVVMSSERRVGQLPTTNVVANAADISRHWSSRLLDPLTSRKVVLVEGPADRVILQGVAQAEGMRTDRGGLAIFEMDGVGFFATAYAFFGPGGFGLPIVGVVDEDARVEAAQIVGVAPASLEGAGIYVCRQDLEEYYVSRLGVPRVLALLAPDGMEEPSIRRATSTPSPSPITQSALAQFCRHKKRKVRCALAIALGMTASDSALMPELAALLVSP